MNGDTVRESTPGPHAHSLPVDGQAAAETVLNVLPDRFTFGQILEFYEAQGYPSTHCLDTLRLLLERQIVVEQGHWFHKRAAD